MINFKPVITAMVLLLSIFSASLHAQTNFSRGEELFMQNRPQEALRFLEASIQEDPAHVQAFLYLGITYLQLNRIEDAITVYTQILPRSGLEAHRVAFNLGNAYFMQGDQIQARQYYSRAIDLNPVFSSAYLNRANSFVRTGDMQDAIMDYQDYLFLEPGSTQREQILRLIAFIREEQEASERIRILAEQAARAAEEAARQEEERQRQIAEAEARAAEEAARIAEERRRQLLAEVNEALQAVAGESVGIGAGSEDMHDFTSDFILD